MKRMPVIFAGHGNPMIALDDSVITRNFKDMGGEIIEKFGTPKGILGISAHWYKKGSFIQSADSPKQIFDMMGFPEELYEVKYEPVGNINLTERVIELIGAEENNDWGIDHGMWTVLTHMFPKADIPVVELSVDYTKTAGEMYELGKKLMPLRDEGYLIIGSGNIVHNLRLADWNNPGGTDTTLIFNDYIVKLIEHMEYDEILDYKNLKESNYAIPTPDHFLPLIYVLGASSEEAPKVFNNYCDFGTISMTSFAFGL